MKKLILIFLFATIGIFAQNGDKATTTMGEREIQYNVYQATKQGLRVILITDSTTARYSGGYSDTTSAAGDSLTPTNVSQWWKFTISTDDTIYFSSDRTYPATNSEVLLPGESFTSEKLNFTYFPKFYYKLKGSGTPNVRLFWQGF